MVVLESFSVWIYGEVVVFNQRKPCLLPDVGYIHIEVTAQDDSLIGIRSNYYYSENRCLSIEYSDEDILELEGSICGSGSFSERLSSFIESLSQEKRRDILNSIRVPCFGSEVANLSHIFIYYYALLLTFKAYFNLPEFWQENLFPLYAKFPSVDCISRKYLKLITTYFVYIQSMKMRSELKPIVDHILTFIDTWSKIFQKGHHIDLDTFKAKLNMDILSYVVEGITSREDSSLSDAACIVSQDHTLKSCESSLGTLKSCESSLGTLKSCESSLGTLKSCESSLGTLKSCESSLGTLKSCESSLGTLKSCESSLGTLKSCESGDSFLYSPLSSCNRYSTNFSSITDNCPLVLPIYQVIEKKKQEIEESERHSTQALTHNFNALSEEVVRYSMGEVRSKIEGCLEESIYNSYPRIKNYIQSALQEKGEYFNTIKGELELEIERTRNLCRQAVLAVECIPIYEERIRYLENEIKTLKKGKESDLEKKVEHLQSSVSQLLRAVRIRA